MQGMVLHAGGWQASRDQIEAVTVPQATASYGPVRHLDLIDTIVRAGRTWNLEPTGERLALAREGAQMFGLLQFSNGHNDREVGLMVGVRNSYDASLSVGIAAGTNVFVCDNMALSGQWMKTRKHTPGAWDDLYAFLFGGLRSVLENHAQFLSHRDAWRGCSLGAAGRDHLVVECARRGAINATEILPVLREFDAPTVEAWNEEPRNAWRLYNAVTQVAKTWSPLMQLERTRKVTDTFVEVLA